MRDTRIEHIINAALTLVVFLIVVFKAAAINDELIATRAEVIEARAEVVAIQEQLAEAQTEIQVYEAIIRGINNEW